MNERPVVTTWSLRRRLALGMVVAALLPVLLFSAALLWSQWQRDHLDLMQRVDSNARLQASVVDDFLEGQQAGVRLLAEQVSAERGMGGEDLARLLYIYPSMLRALRVDARGNIVAARDTRGRVLPTQVRGVADEDWFKAARSQFRAFVSDVERNVAYGDEIVVTVSAPVLRERQFEGALQAAIPVESFARLSAASLARRNFELLLLDRSNRVVFASHRLRWEALQEAGRVGAEIRQSAVTADHPGSVVLREGLLRDGGSAYVEAVAMRNGWTLVLVAPRDILLAPLLPRLLLLAALLGLTFLGVAGALWRQRKLLRDSIGYLLASLRGYALGGRMGATTSGEIPDELAPLVAGIGDLGERMNTAFDELRHVLDERDEVIAERTRELRRAVSELDRLSRTDGLTGSLNYRGFHEAGTQLWREASETGRPLAVLALDIDFFKRYNDLYGHAEGDGALRRFAGAVRSALLHKDDVLARPGGEEFTVFLPGSSFEQALQVGERVCQRVRDADIAHTDSPHGRLTVSVGVAAMAPGDIGVEDVLRRADAALYRAKVAGRNQVGH